MACSNRTMVLPAATAVFAWSCLASGCLGSERSGPQPLTDSERAAVVFAVDSAVQAFRQADVDLDGQRVVDHLWPEFYMYGDGVRSEHAAVRENILAFMAGLRSFDTEWSDVEVLALGRDAALASFRFRDSIVTAEGALLRSQGPTTLLWQRRGREWRLLYADADHYPVADADSTGTRQ